MMTQEQIQEALRDENMIKAIAAAMGKQGEQQVIPLGNVGAGFDPAAIARAVAALQPPQPQPQPQGGQLAMTQETQALLAKLLGQQNQNQEIPQQVIRSAGEGGFTITHRTTLGDAFLISLMAGLALVVVGGVAYLVYRGVRAAFGA